MRDYEIREILRAKHLKNYIEDHNSKVVEELSLPTTKARVDMAVINGHLHAYEIKGANDTLNRLPNQLAAYTKVFDYVTVVTEEKHKSKIMSITEPWVGILLCEPMGKLTLARKSKINNGKDPFSIAKLLWNSELLDMLTNLEIPHRKKDRNWILCENLSQGLPIKKLSEAVRERLKIRENWKVKE